jgi:hypothetical protein
MTSSCWSPASWSPALRRLLVRVAIAAAGSVLLAPAAAAAVYFWHLKGVSACLMAVIAALPIVGLLAANAAFLKEEKDEFQRNVFVQCLLGGIGGTLVATTIWGNLESFVHAPHLNPVVVYPIFWIFVLISAPVVLARYR